MTKRPALLLLAAGVIWSGLLGLSPAPSAAQLAASPTPERDWALPAGRFYTQAGAGRGGFSITDDDGLGFWTAFQRLGGASALGYPASRRFEYDGFIYQATQAAVLQWRPDSGTVVLGNSFELLERAGLDEWLATHKGVPRPITDDGATSHDDAVRIRMSWLTDPAISQRYLANPNPQVFRSWSQADSIQLYGLPMSRPERLGPFIAQRFQRIALQVWVEALPGMPAPGTVTPVLGGDLLKESGLVGGAAATPHTAAAVVSRPVSLAATAFPSGPGGLAFPTATLSPAQRQAATATARALPPGAHPSATPLPSGAVQILDGTLSEYAIFLSQHTARTGTVRFTLTNVGVLRHNIRILGNGIDRKSPDLAGGRSGTVDVTFLEPGTYTIYCDLADHEARGMTLSFTVEPGTSQ